MLVLTWNLFHGRAVPPAGRDLQAEFAAALGGWEWDVALLQEVPPWWPAAFGYEHRTALTSRNLGLALRRRLAQRWPDVMRSGGGSANAILVRGERILEHRRRRLRWLPERRVLHAVRLSSGAWVANLHAQVHSDERACADIAQAAETVRAWSQGAPFVLGGDMNVRSPAAAGLVHAGGHGVDHVLTSFTPQATTRVLDRGPLSDHAPVLVALEGWLTPGRQEKA